MLVHMWKQNAQVLVVTQLDALIFHRLQVVNVLFYSNGKPWI
jgi:hypothetical protein